MLFSGNRQQEPLRRTIRLKFKGTRLAFTLVHLAMIHTVQEAHGGWQHYTQFDGLNGVGVTDMIEDRNGSLWVSYWSTTGVSRYDGVRWVHYREANGGPDVLRPRLLEDRDGNIWVLGRTDAVINEPSYTRLYRFDGHSWTTPSVPQTIDLNRVDHMAQDSSGVFWFGGTALLTLDEDTWTTVVPGSSPPTLQVNDIEVDQNGNVWFATKVGARRWDGTEWTYFTTADGLLDDDLLEVFVDKTNNIWFASALGISRFGSSGDWDSFASADDLLPGRIGGISQDVEGHLWVAQNGGASRYDGTRWRSYTSQLDSDLVYAVLADRTGNIWFGRYDGLTRFDRSEMFTFEGVAADKIRVARDESGQEVVWLQNGHTLQRFDGSQWSQLDLMGHVPNGAKIWAMELDSAANPWLGFTASDGAGGVLGGAIHLENQVWISVSDSLENKGIKAIFSDVDGQLWFGTVEGLIFQFSEASGWRRYTHIANLNGDPSKQIWSIAQDSEQNYWFATEGIGVVRLDTRSNEWETYDLSAWDPDARLPYDVAAASSGEVWVATDGGIFRYDGTWTRFSLQDGLTSRRGRHIAIDFMNRVWVATTAGLNLFQESRWGHSVEDPLKRVMLSLAVTNSGVVWTSTRDATGQFVTVRYEPDFVPPQTAILSPRPDLVSSRSPSASYAAAWGEAESMQYSYSLDGGFWSSWTNENVWTSPLLADGWHEFGVRAQDALGNVDATPAIWNFEVDATPPQPVISQPTFAQAVRGRVAIRGTAADSRFKSYEVRVRVAGAPTWDDPIATTIHESQSPVVEDVLAEWSTLDLPDGDYELRLSVEDHLGLVGTALVGVIVDNVSPSAQNTTPVTITNATGGDVFTTNKELHLYFPPNAFDRDFVVIRIDTIPGASVPESLPDGAMLSSRGYEVSWNGAMARKPVVLEMSWQSAMVPGNTGSLAIHSSSGGEWFRLGGTVDESRAVLSLAITSPGHFAMYSGSTGASGSPPGLSSVSLTPKVFSPTGTYANSEARIGFTLGQAGPVSVSVFNRAGRLVKEIVSGLPMNAGTNLVSWNGRDRSDRVVPVGLYIVTVEALGDRQTQALSVVR